MTEEQKEEVIPDDSQFMEELHLEDFNEYEEIFKLVGNYKTGKATLDEVHARLFEIHYRQLKKEDLQKILDETDLSPDGAISIFNCIILLKKLIDFGTKEKLSRILKKKGNGLFRTLDPEASKRKKRDHSDKEKNKYAKLCNKHLKNDPDVKDLIPIDPTTDELYDKLKDGRIIGKLANKLQEGAVDPLNTASDMDPYQKFDNVKAAVEGAKKAGVNTETTPDDVADGDKGRDDDLLCELFKRLAVPKDKIKASPETDKLLEPGETKDDLAELPVDDFLKRWMNNHLKNAGEPEINNFGDDCKDSKPYVALLNDLNPKECNKDALNEGDPTNRAKKVLDNSKKIGTDTEVQPEDIAGGEEPLNKLFVADVFNAYNDSLADNGPASDAMKAYVKMINDLLADDGDCKDKIPIDPEGDEVFDKLKDGIILAKLENIADGNTIDENGLKKDDNLNDDDKKNNLDKVIEGADKLGCNSDAKPNDVMQGKQQKVEDLVGKILDKINAKKALILEDADTDNLCKDGEDKNKVADLSPDDFLKRWFNHRLNEAKHPEELSNFTDDVKNGDKYVALLNDLFPEECDKSGMDIADPVERCKKVIEDAKKVGVDTVVTPEQLASGDEKLNRLFTGEVYNAYANPYCNNEKVAYCKLMNKILADDEHVKEKLPINPDNNEVFKKIQDGLILSKLINMNVPSTVDERAISTGKITRDEKLANINLVINAAKSLGCPIETTAENVIDEKRQDIVDLLYQLLKPIELNELNLQKHPELLRLKGEKEDTDEMLTVGPEDFLIRWFNMHLKNGGHEKLANLADDVKDAARYTVLENQIAPDTCDKSGLDEADLKKRSEKVLDGGEKVGANVYIVPDDIVSGNEHLNTLFTAELYRAKTGMGEPTEDEKKTIKRMFEDDEEGGREERSFRTWINSLKLKDQPKIHNLYEQCRSGVLLLKIIDKIKPGIVNWKKVELHTKIPFKLGVNCQEVIDSAKKSGYSIVGIGPTDIREGKKKFILAIVWQLMRAHTLQVIGSKPEEELVKWANERVEHKIKTLKDKTTNSLFWLELLSSIEPKAVRWDIVVKDNLTDKDMEMNAKYALSVARGLGACIFVVWEDITQTKSKLLLTFLASIYDIYERREKDKKK